MKEEKKEFKWSLTHYIAAIAISASALFLIYAQNDIKGFIVDNITVMLLGIAALPWLSLFFKKGKIGDISWDNYGKAQGSVKKIHPPIKFEMQIPVSETIEQDLEDESKKILRTLWRYQKATFKDDFAKRWTFIINPISKEYTNYLKGLTPLLDKGLVVVTPENHQCMLSNEGILFIEQHQELQEGVDYYYF